MTEGANSPKTKMGRWLLQKVMKYLKVKRYLDPYIDRVEYHTFHYTAQNSEDLAIEINVRQRNLFHSGIKVSADTHIVVMGQDEFMSVLKKKDANFFSVDSQVYHAGPFFQTDPYHGRRIMNWQVHVVPYLKGFAFIPKVAVEVKVPVKTEFDVIR